MARVARARRRRATAGWWLAAGLAAAVLLGVGVEQQMKQQREIEAGMEARRDVLRALRVTNQKFDLALRAVHELSSAPDPEAPGV
jgi:hypothetical protein